MLTPHHCLWSGACAYCPTIQTLEASSSQFWRRLAITRSLWPSKPVLTPFITRHYSHTLNLPSRPLHYCLHCLVAQTTQTASLGCSVSAEPSQGSGQNDKAAACVRLCCIGSEACSSGDIVCGVTARACCWPNLMTTPLLNPKGNCHHAAPSLAAVPNVCMLEH